MIDPHRLAVGLNWYRTGILLLSGCSLKLHECAKLSDIKRCFSCLRWNLMWILMMAPTGHPCWPTVACCSWHVRSVWWLSCLVFAATAKCVHVLNGVIRILPLPSGHFQTRLSLLDHSIAQAARKCSSAVGLGNSTDRTCWWSHSHRWVGWSLHLTVIALLT
jgi:hypothetical protein